MPSRGELVRPARDEEAVRAFETLLNSCLNVNMRDNFLLIYDESMTDLLPHFEDALEGQGISATLIFIPLNYQQFLIRHSKTRGGKDRIDLPAAITAAMSASTAIVNALDATASNAPLRKAVNHTPRPKTCRLATIPGINRDVLRAISDAPIELIVAACEEMAWMLGQSSTAEVVSHDSAGNEYRLSAALGGWDHEPIMSPGMLLPGSWGNVPPGETFCCPPHKLVNGKICINGSIPGHVLGIGEEVVLEFDRGKLAAVLSPVQNSASPVFAFLESHRQRAAGNNDDHWNTFAELGIGLNPMITRLTGNPLFDEKAGQTLHIAIGDNSVFGDDVVSFIHEDLVTRKPSLYLDGRLVMERGRIDRALIQKLRQAHPGSIPDLTVNDARIYLRESRIGLHKDILMRRLSKAQRVNYVRMASDQISNALNELCDSLLTFDEVHIAGFLKAHKEFSGIPSVRLLGLLEHYRVLGIKPTAFGNA